MVCWIADDTRLFRANCFPTDRVILNWNRCSHIHWPIFLLHWDMDQKTEVRSHIKCRIKPNIDSKQIFNELCDIYGPQTISMRTVFRWVKAFKVGKFSVEDDTRPGGPKTSVTKANIAAVKIVVEQDARLSVKDIASCTGISEGSVQTILKKRLHLRKVCARSVPHLLTEVQKTQHLKCARELLKTYKGCNSRVISNLLTCDETWVHISEPQRRADNKQWKRKALKRPCIAKRTISSKKMLYAIFFNSNGPVVQVPCPSGHTVTGRFYKNSVLKKVKKFYNKKRPSKGWSGVHLLHDNASSHQCEVKSFLASEVLSHPLYSPDLRPCDFLFPRLKKMLSGNKYTSRNSLGSAIYLCLQQTPKENYLSAFRDWVKRLQNVFQ